MAEVETRVFLCDCEGTMPVAAAGLGKSLIAAGITQTSFHHRLCRGEVARFEQGLADPAAICVACTQESPLFAEIAGEAGRDDIHFVNIRETAGWSDEAPASLAKMTALIAAAAMPITPARLRSIESDGLCLVIGRGQTALDAAARLDRTLSVTLLLVDAEDLILPTVLDFPVFTGRVVAARGSLGAFELTIDGHAALAPSSRGRPVFAPPRDGARSTCSVVFDISGGAPLFGGSEGRDGYFRADPGDRAAVLDAVLTASDYVGTFEKPIYATVDETICAHARSRKIGCTKCIDNCPAGAVTPNGDAVAIDPGICGGCGNCAAHCPTGAIAYTYPDRRDQIGRVQLLARTHLAAGGASPVLLLHDAVHGTPLIGAMARWGRGLPARVIPLELHSITSVGHDLMAAALAAGFESVVVLADPAKSEALATLAAESDLMEALLAGFGHAGPRVVTLIENDPDTAAAELWALPALAGIAYAAPAPLGGKREVARAALEVLAAAGTPTAEILPLPRSAPYGRIEVDTGACTLCLACVSACPADALRDRPDKPQLRFVESACVQCGICAATCPEKAIRLEPRYNLAASALQPVVLYEDEPALCTSCGKPFAASGILRAVERRLGNTNPMFDTKERLALIRMCESCRLEELSKDGADPFAIAHTRRTRTTDDYKRAEERGLTIDDFLAED